MTTKNHRWKHLFSFKNNLTVLNERLKPGFEYQITFWIECVCVVKSSDLFVLKKLVLNCGIKSCAKGSVPLRRVWPELYDYWDLISKFCPSSTKLNIL